MKFNLRNRLLKNTLFFFFGALLLFLLLDFVILPWYVSSPEVKVPNVVGMKEDNAVEALKNAYLSPVVADTTYDEKHPVGTVILQNPKPGDVVKEGRRTYIFISGGEPIVNVPLLKGRSLRDARFSLERIGLKLGSVEEVNSPNPKDVIFDQQYAPGTPLKKGESVNVSISLGEIGSGEIVVPDLIGKSLAEAERLLQDLSLSIGKVNYQSSFSLLPNTILDQYPSKGSKIAEGGTIDLFVTKAADPSQQDIFEE
jgi:eukaryotic-like serine/threonine-protein kinase